MNDLNEMYGFIKATKTEAELAQEKVLMTANKIVAHGKLVQVIKNNNLNDVYFTQIAQLVGQSKKIQVKTVTEKLLDVEVKNAVSYFHDVLKGSPQFYTPNGVFFKENANGVKVIVPFDHPIIKKYLSKPLKNDVQFQLTAGNLSPEMIDAYSRVLIVSERGNVGKYQNNGTCITGVVSGNTLNEVTRNLPLFDVMILATMARIDMSVLAVDPQVHCVIECSSVFEDIKVDKKWVKMEWGVATTSNPYLPIIPGMYGPIYKLNGEHGFFGISNPDSLKDGMIKAFETYEGFLDLI